MSEKPGYHAALSKLLTQHKRCLEIIPPTEAGYAEFCRLHAEACEAAKAHGKAKPPPLRHAGLGRYAAGRWWFDYDRDRIAARLWKEDVERLLECWLTEEEKAMEPEREATREFWGAAPIPANLDAPKNVSSGNGQTKDGRLGQKRFHLDGWNICLTPQEIDILETLWDEGRFKRFTLVGLRAEIYPPGKAAKLDSVERVVRSMKREVFRQTAGKWAIKTAPEIYLARNERNEKRNETS